MADKRISQLIERTDIANNDVLPIVASGATTTNKVTVSTLQDWMQDNLDVGVTSVGITIGSTGTDINVSGSPITTSGNITINIPTASATNRGLLSSANWTTFNNKLSSVGLTMPSAFTVSNSPLTANGTIAVTGAGTVAQYIRGDGSLADFPEAGGGGASVSYYLNGSVSQGTIGGIAYYEMNKTPILGTGTDFVAIADGYLASFITDAGDPSLLEIPGGNWNFETYFSASSGGGSPSFYIELYKVSSGGTATLIASNSAVPELIAFGTTITPYFSTLAVPTTSLALTDRLALRYYVARSGRTITLHTENSHLCQIITTFTTGLTALNGLTAQVQNFATGTSGTDFNISSASSTHTFNLPDASASNRGVVTTGTQTFAGYKIFNGTIGANVDIQLATQGTALNTFIKNINATGQTSIGSNGFGFNNANNIYFSGSSKGGGIIAFSNTGNQTYTLQDASGTLAFTSDLNSYLPLTGGTLTGTLGGTAATFSGTITAQSSAGSGLRMYGSSGTNQWDIYLNSTNLRISDNTGTGNIVFDRPLNGTSASLSSTLTATKGTFNGTTSEPIRIERFVSGSAVGRYSLSISSVGNFSLYDAIADSDRLIVNQSTGAATFSGALNGTSASFTGDINTNRGNDRANIAFNTTAGVSRWGMGLINSETGSNVGGDFTLFRYNDNGTFNSFNLTMNRSTGAATFSSSVTATRLTASNSTDLLLNLERTAVGAWGFNVTSAGNFFLNNRFGSNVFHIADSGNVGIGTASPSQRLTVSGGYISQVDGGVSTFLGYDGTGSLVGTTTNHYLRFITNDTERMRITSGGYLKASNTGSYLSSTSPIHEIRSSANDDWTANISHSATSSPYGISIRFTGASPNGSINYFLECIDSTTSRLRIASNGNVTNVNGSYGSISDIKLKENITDATPKLEDLLKVKVRNYNLIGEETKQIGVIAQELEEVFPAMIDESEDFEEVEVPQLDEEGNEVLNEEGEVVTTKERVSKGTTTKSVKYSVFVPMLIKAIQEQQEQINQLKNQINQL